MFWRGIGPVLVTVLALALALAPTASAGSCSSFSFGSLRATDVKKTGDVTCARVRAMIRSTYGEPGGYKRTNPSVGRPVVYWKGGWRCSNGAGGAGCSNVKRKSWRISATVAAR